METILFFTTLFLLATTVTVTTLFVIYRKKVGSAIGWYDRFLHRDMPFFDNPTEAATGEFVNLFSKL